MCRHGEEASNVLSSGKTPPHWKDPRERCDVTEAVRDQGGEASRHTLRLRPCRKGRAWARARCPDAHRSPSVPPSERGPGERRAPHFRRAELQNQSQGRSPWSLSFNLSYSFVISFKIFSSHHRICLLILERKREKHRCERDTSVASCNTLTCLEKPKLQLRTWQGFSNLHIQASPLEHAVSCVPASGPWKHWLRKRNGGLTEESAISTMSHQEDDNLPDDNRGG